MALSKAKQVSSFEAFFDSNEAGLRHALIAVFGIENGRDAAAHAWSYGWENWDRLGEMKNPAGYLYRVGQTWGRRNSRQPKLPPVIREHHEPWVEPRLPEALDSLSDQQRVAVVLRHGSDWEYDQIANLLDISASTVRKHVERGLAKLRVELEVSS